MTSPPLALNRFTAPSRSIWATKKRPNKTWLNAGGSKMNSRELTRIRRKSKKSSSG